MKHRIVNAGLCVLLLVSMLAFEPSRGVSAQQNPQMLRLGSMYPFYQFDPLFVENSTEAVIVEQLFLGLTGLDPNGNLLPELAESWEISEDGLRWTFNVRQGVKWVDSARYPIRDVNARDVLVSLDRARQFGNFDQILEAIEVMDEYRVMLILRTPSFDLANVLAVSPAAKIVPSDLVQELGAEWTQVGMIWSDGPCLLVGRSEMTVQLEANPFWSERYGMEARSAWMEFIKDPREALQRYLRGEFDLIELDPEFWKSALQEEALAKQATFMEGIGMELYSGAPFARLPGMGHSYLAKPYLLPVYSRYFGLDNLYLWGFDTRAPEVQIPGTTRVLNGETLGLLQFISEDQSELVFERMTPQLNLIFPDDIIVGDTTLKYGNEAAPFGFLRRVVNTFGDGSGRFVVQTVPAALEEAVESGGQSLDIPLDNLYRDETLSASFPPQDGDIVPMAYAPPYAGLQVTIDEVVYDADNDKNTTNDQIKARGWVNIAPGANLKMDLNIHGHQLQSFHFVNTLQEKARIELYSNVALLNFEKSVEIKRFTFAPITASIGLVPVVITPQLSITVGVNGKVSVGISTGIDQSATIVTSASYENGNWDSKFGINNNQIGPLETELKQSAKAGVFAGPKLSVILYGVVAPYGQIKGYLTLSGDPAAAPLWKLTAGITGEIGVKVQILSFIVASYTSPPIVILPEQLLAQAGGGVTPPADIPPAVTPIPKDEPVPDACDSIWWPPGCWTWWIWVLVVIAVIVILAILFG